MDINNIPLELLLKILSYIPQNELYHTISQVCRHWEKLSILPDFWRTVSYDDLSQLPQSSVQKYSKMENRVAHIRNIQTYVQELSITRMGISDIQTIVFPDLKHLHIREEISGQLFKDVLKRCPKLQTIDIHMYNPMICSFDLFCGLNLKEIKISFLLPTSETINNDLIFLTETNPNLEKLDLNVKVRYGNVLHCGVHLQLEDHTIRQILNQSRNLKTLALRNCSVSSKGFTSCGINLGLTELTISNSYLFDDNGIECVTKNAKNLLVLEILECNKITDKSIASIAENCPRLQCLSIYHPHVGVQITNESLLVIANACRNLKRLYWRFRSKNRNTMDSGVIAIANTCRFLVKISFDNNVDIGDLSLSSIATYCLFLREASFSGCYGITFKGVKTFISSCIWLEKLDCSFCEGIMDDDYSTVTTNTRKSNEPRETTDETKSNQDKPEEFYNRADGCVQDDVAIPYTDPQTERVFIRHHYHDQDDGYIVHSHLKYLSLKACRLLSNVTILTLFELCPDLREVDLIGTNADIDQLLYDRIKQLCPFLNLENSQVPT